jgi:hypothetical protein
MSYTVRIYGDDPQAGPGALLSEHDYTSGVQALEFIAGAIGDGYAVELLAVDRGGICRLKQAAKKEGNAP